MEPVISVENLSKKYQTKIAVDSVSFEVFKQEIFCIVGPNGAGKTTTLECLEGLIQPDHGKIKILDIDPLHEAKKLYLKIGIQLQSAALPPRLKVIEIVDFFSALYPKSKDKKYLLETFSLADKKDQYYVTLSGGEKQRLFIILALIHDPEIVFLDEISTGLDPQARTLIWEEIRKIREQGKTVVFSTHYMEEAEALSDRVMIIDEGKIVALDRVENLLKNENLYQSATITFYQDYDLNFLHQLKAGQKYSYSGQTLKITGKGETFLYDLILLLSANGIKIKSITAQTASLNDLFLLLTNKEFKNQDLLK